MEKEISSGSMLGIVLIALASIIGLGLCFYSIAFSMVEPTATPLITKLALLFSGLSVAEYVFLKYSNNKLKIWDNHGDERDSILSKCDVDIYEDSIQVRIPKKISFFKALRCKLSDVAVL